MRDLHPALMTTAWRGLKGMLVGSVMATIIAVALMCLLFGTQLLFDIHEPTERAEELKNLKDTVPLTAVLGVVVGIIAGLATSLPRKGMTILLAIVIVYGCVGWYEYCITRRLDVTWQEPYVYRREEAWPVMLASFAAITGGAIAGVLRLVCMARFKAHRSSENANRPSWYVVGQRFVGEVLRWTAISALAVVVLHGCYDIIHHMYRPVHFPFLILSIGCAAYVTYWCERNGYGILAPLAGGGVGYLGMGMVHPLVEKNAQIWVRILGLFISLLVLLLLVGKPAKPNRDVSPPPTPE